MEIDYTKFVDEALPKAFNLAKTSDINGAIESLAFDTAKIQAYKDEMKEVLKCDVLFIVLTPHSNEQ
uniref:Uncharacterized protein n=1 Tax=Panagrolaimus davidi TaxID=227884 RepID=A0A914P6D0_9BILA